MDFKPDVGSKTVGFQTRRRVGRVRRVGSGWQILTRRFSDYTGFFFSDPTRLVRLTVVGSDSNLIQHIEFVTELLTFDTQTCTQAIQPDVRLVGLVGFCFVGKS